MIKKLLFVALIFPSSLSLAFAGSVDDLLKSGEAKNKAGNYQGAVDDYSAAIQLNEAETGKYLKNLEQYSNLTEFEKASIENAELFEVRHDLAVPYYGRALGYIGLSKSAEAMKDLDMAVKIDEKYGDAWCELGLLKHEAGKKDEGCIDLRTAADLGSVKAKDEYENKFCWNSSLNYAKEGTSKLNLRKYEAALTDFNLAVKLNPDSASNYCKRGLCYYGLGKFDKAIEDFSKAAEIDAKGAEYPYHKGMAFYSQEKFEQAFEEFGKAIRLNVNYFDAYLYRGYSCEGMGQSKSALYDYGQAIRIKPDDGMAYYRRGLLKQEYDNKGACEDFRKASELGIFEAEGYVEECDAKKK